MNDGLVVTAELSRDHRGDFLQVKVTPKEYLSLPIASDYPIHFRLDTDDTVSNFEKAFDMIRLVFLEQMHLRRKEDKFNEEFKKDPEGFLMRALKTTRDNILPKKNEVSP